MSFSDRSIMDTIVTGVFDVDCCWCFTGLCVQQDVGTGGSQGCSIFWCSVTWNSTSSEAWQYLAFIFSPLCCPRTALASYLCQSESHSSWNKLLSSIFFGNVCALKGQGPCGGHFIFSNLHHFAAQMFGCFLGAYVSKLPELCWNRYFRTGDGNLYLCLVEWHKKIKSYFFMTMIPPTLNHKKLKIQTWSWSRILFFYWTDPITMVEKEFWSVHRVSVGTTDRNFFTCQYTLLHFLWVSWLSPSWETSTEHREWKWHIYLALSPFIPF